MELIGIVRDFQPDHPDFDVVPPAGYGHNMWNVATSLANDLPIYIGGGFRVTDNAHDVDGRPICWTLYNPAQGDTPAVPGNPDNGQIASAETFSEWFRDIPGVNMSTLVSLTGILRHPGEDFAGMYEFNIPQFYPIDDMLFGNDGEHNNFFTFEIVAEFTHDSSKDYQLMLKGDDDVWAFLEGQLVADLAGFNGSPEQWIDLDRLNLVDGQTYRFHFFATDRSDASSRFHLVTNIPLTSVVPTTILAIFD
jgi:fibro-slime domain-containing protein